jgi:hypothetical protein
MSWQEARTSENTGPDVWCTSNITSFRSFLTELRNIAVNSRLISSSTFGRMKKSPILLGSQRKLQSSGEQGTSAGDLDDDEWDLQYDLRRPDQIVIADDTNAHQFFGDSLFTAPQEDIIEGSFLFVFRIFLTRTFTQVSMRS